MDPFWTRGSSGRLASNEPNLQNIPLRTEEAKKIRAAFQPPHDALFVETDYSEFELRIMTKYCKADR